MGFRSGTRIGQEQALLTPCSSIIAIVDPRDSRVVQFSQFSVKEFLTSPRLASPSRDVSHFHIILEPANTVLAQACMAVLLRLEDNVQGGGIIPLLDMLLNAESSMRNSRMSGHGKGLMNSLMQTSRTSHCGSGCMSLTPLPVTLHRFSCSVAPFHMSVATPLYYAALCRFHELAVSHCQVSASRGRWWWATSCRLPRQTADLTSEAWICTTDPSSLGPTKYDIFNTSHYGTCSMRQFLLANKH